MTKDNLKSKNVVFSIMNDPLDYLFDTAMSFVQTQSRFLCKEIRDNPKYAKEFAKGRIPPELGKKAKKNVTNQLEKVIKFRQIQICRCRHNSIRN